MLKEFIESISTMAVQAAGMKLIETGRNARTQLYAYQGMIHERPISPALFCPRVESFADLYSLIEQYGIENAPQATIWHGEHFVMGIFDLDDRREFATLLLRKNESFVALESLPRDFDQRSLLTFLKRDLCGLVSDTIIAIFRQLDFSKREDYSGSIKHTDESLGRSVQAAVTGRSEIPEWITVAVAPYICPDAARATPVMLSVDIDPQRCTIRLTCAPNELSNAIADSHKLMNERLLNHPDAVPVFHGNPFPAMKVEY